MGEEDPKGRRGSVLPRSGRFAYTAECFGMLRGTRRAFRGASVGSFLATQCSAPRERGCYFFIACPVRRAARACDKKAECFGMLRGTRYTRSAELPLGSFLVTQCSAPRERGECFLCPGAAPQARAPGHKKTPPLIAGVRCIGRSYRNRTYTMGVRGPCATTTPSSNARMIIAHYFAFCNRFCQQY